MPQQDPGAPIASTSRLAAEPPPPANTKKRSRASLSEAGGSVGSTGKGKAPAAGDEEDNHGKKKRLALSCVPCRKRKISCDRKQPCSACIRRKVAHDCHWEDDEDPSSNSFALTSDLRQLARRLAHLESLFEQTNPGLLPTKQALVPGSIGPTSKPSPSASPRRHERNGISPAQNREESTSDTEDAAATLEEAAFGARVPVLRALGAADPTNREARASSSQSRTGMELTEALTSILAEPLSFDQDGRPRSSVRLGLDLAISTEDLPRARSGSMAQVFTVLPSRDIAEFLIQKYFAEMEWDYRVLDPVAFPLEYDRFNEMLAAGREDQIDPLWVAVLAMVLALALEGFWSRPGGKKDVSLFRGLSERDMMDLPAVWHDASLRALQLGEWGGTPRVRTVQTILLFVQYIQLSSPSGQTGRILGWVASGIRVAQRMGLHRLGSNPETMPPDDPALPPGTNSVKRETCVRLFNSLVCIDSLLSDSPVFRCYLLHPTQYNTARPLNLNFTELSRVEWRTPAPAPPNVYTDASFEIAQCAAAETIRRALDKLVLSTDAFSYAKVLEQDRQFHRVLAELPDVFSERSPVSSNVRLRYQRCLLYEDINARLVRLHRPFLSRGYNSSSPFHYSTQQCVTSARSIINSNFELLSITTSHWWLYSGTMRAVSVLFLDLFHQIDEDVSHAEVNEKRNILVKASIIFGTDVAIPALQAVIEQGRRILSGLFAAEENRRMTRAAQTLAPADESAPALESFAQIFKRVSRDVLTEEQSMPVARPPPLSDYPTFPSAPNPVSFAQDMSAYDYWGAGATPGSNFGPFLGAGGQETAFFDSLASEDWSNGSPSDGSLLGQMASIW